MNRATSQRVATVGLLALLLMGAGCNRSASQTASGNQPNPTATGQGFLSVAIHDKPPPDPTVTQLMVSISLVRVHSSTSDAWTDLPSNPAPFDLLTLQNGRSLSVVVKGAVPAGSYDELRLVFQGDPLATVDGKQEPIKAPSTMTSGYKIKGAFTIAPNMCTTISVDFNAKDSLKPNGPHNFILQPVLRIDNTQIATCQGNPPIAGSTPENALEAFTKALEANDPTLAASYFALSVRDTYAGLLQVANLQLLAQSLRNNPPVRVDQPRTDDRYAVFVTKRTMQGQLQRAEIDLHREGSTWVIIRF